jgi:hypothetical protein
MALQWPHVQIRVQVRLWVLAIDLWVLAIGLRVLAIDLQVLVIDLQVRAIVVADDPQIVRRPLHIAHKSAASHRSKRSLPVRSLSHHRLWSKIWPI